MNWIQAIENFIWMRDRFDLTLHNFNRCLFKCQINQIKHWWQLHKTITGFYPEIALLPICFDLSWQDDTREVVPTFAELCPKITATPCLPLKHIRFHPWAKYSKRSKFNKQINAPWVSSIKIINKWVGLLVTGQKQPVYVHQVNPQTCGVLYEVTRLENHFDTATYSVILVHPFEK